MDYARLENEFMSEGDAREVMHDLYHAYNEDNLLRPVRGDAITFNPELVPIVREIQDSITNMEEKGVFSHMSLNAQVVDVALRRNFTKLPPCVKFAFSKAEFETIPISSRTRERCAVQSYGDVMSSRYGLNEFGVMVQHLLDGSLDLPLHVLQNRLQEILQEGKNIQQLVNVLSWETSKHEMNRVYWTTPLKLVVITNCTNDNPMLHGKFRNHIPKDEWACFVRNFSDVQSAVEHWVNLLSEFSHEVQSVVRPVEIARPFEMSAAYARERKRQREEMDDDEPPLPAIRIGSKAAALLRRRKFL